MQCSRVISIILASILLQGCFDFNAKERKAVRAELAQLDSSIEQVSSEVESLRGTVDAMETTLSSRRANLTRYEREVRQYMNQHRGAVAAIGAGVGGAQVAIDSKSEYSEDVESIGAGVAVIAGLYAMANAEEVSQVANVMSDADRNTKMMKNEIAALEYDLSKALGRLKEKEAALSVLSNNHTIKTQELVELQ